MGSGSFLMGMAQLGIVLAGFISVFIVVVAQEGKLARSDAIHLVTMISGSLFVVLAALAPFAALYAGVPEAQMWTVSCAAMLLAGLALAVVVTWMLLRLTAAERRAVGYAHMALSYALAGVAVAFYAAGVFGHRPDASYFVAVIFTFLVGLLGFVTFALQRFVFRE